MLKEPTHAAMGSDQAEATKELARAARAAYMRRYRRENPERIKAINEAYWRRRAIRENGMNIGKGE